MGLISGFATQAKSDPQPMRPKNERGEFVWLAGSAPRFPFLYAEGTLDVVTTPNEVWDALSASLPEIDVSWTHDLRGFHIASSDVFKTFLLRRDFRCAAVASLPIGLGAATLHDGFGQLGQDLRRVVDTVVSVLDAGGEPVALRFERLDSQISVHL